MGFNNCLCFTIIKIKARQILTVFTSICEIATAEGIELPSLNGRVQNLTAESLDL